MCELTSLNSQTWKNAQIKRKKAMNSFGTKLSHRLVTNSHKNSHTSIWEDLSLPMEYYMIDDGHYIKSSWNF
jgi:hypothetical protein